MKHVMSMRAFTPERAEPLPGSTIELDDEESHYLVKVRRARIGDALELFDGRGGAWAASLRTTGRHASVEVGAPLCFAEPVPRVVLLGLPDQPATLEALTRDVPDVVALNNLALAYLQLERADAAFAALEKARVADPEDARTFENLAFVNIQVGRLDEAEKEGRQEIEID